MREDEPSLLERPNQVATSTIATARPQPLTRDAMDRVAALDREPGRFFFGRWKNINVLAWAAVADAVAAERLRRALAKPSPAFSVGHSTISIIGQELPTPTDEARQKISALLKSSDGQLACLAVLIEGTGFTTSALRSAHTAMRLETSRSYDMGLLSTVDELAEWFPPRHLHRTGVALSPARLREIVAEARLLAARS